MSITRKTQLIFGGDLVPTGNIAKWGSLKDGTPGYSNDPALIQSSEWANGLNGAVIGNRSPAQEDLNGLFYLLTYQLAYILERGMPEWDTNTAYFQNDFCRKGRTLYISQTDNNQGHDPASDSNNWHNFFADAQGPRVCAAWAEFDGINSTGGNAILRASSNVDHVVRNEDGSYTVVFEEALADDNYAVAGMCGSEDGQAYGPGDDAVIVGNVTGKGNAVRSTTQCRIFTINPTNKALVSPGSVSVQFFAP